MKTHIWLRSETKPSEERTALTPESAARMLEAGFQLTVEKSSQSCFSWKEYESVGCEIADEHSWYQSAPDNAIILGLKELEESDSILKRRHIHFAHVYKEQAGWQQFLNRFQGDGRLYDLEFLVDENGRRVAAFGHWAGYAGAALAVLAWCNHQAGRSPVLNPVESRKDQNALVSEIKSSLDNISKRPRAMVICGLGRCGKGAIELLQAVGAEIVSWDMEETARGGPFEEILDCDIFLNCVFISESIPPFITKSQLKTPDRKLSVICDVSCDPYGTYNPVPVYERCTTFDHPVEVLDDGPKPLYLIAIDHLPSLLPRESSEDFCNQLMHHLLQLNDLDQSVWKRASDLFDSKLNLI